MKLNFLIFAGTTEGRQLTEYLLSYDLSLMVCVATEYGETLLPKHKNLRLSSTRLNEKEMKVLMTEEHFDLVIDATHPFATEVSKNIVRACEETSTKYLRLLRESEPYEKSCVYVSSIEEAVDYLKTTKGNVLLTTGSKDLSAFTQIADYKERLYARVLSTPSVAASCSELGFVGSHLICMQGPFSEDLNYAMLQQISASYLVTKESGQAGGFLEKINAAKRAGVITIVIGKPVEQVGLNFKDTIDYLTLEYSLLEKEAYNTEHRTSRKVSIIGIGMGNPDTLTLGALKALENCDCIIGAKRMVEGILSSIPNRPYYIEYQEHNILNFMNTHTEYRHFAIVYSGDIGFYSGAKKLYPFLTDYEVDTYAGISSMVYFCSKLQLPWEDVYPLSLHGKDDNIIDAVKNNKKVFALLDRFHSPSFIVETLIEHGLTNITLHVGEHLSYPEEQIISDTPLGLQSKTFDALAVILIENLNYSSPIVTHGYKDEVFKRGKVPMTKAEVRSISISKLELMKDSIIYDIGAGTGSVSIEMALQSRKGHVYAIEKNPEGIQLIKENAKNLTVTNLTTIEGTAPEVIESLESPTHCFIGGSSGNLKSILRILFHKNPKIRVVLNCITLETLTEAMECIKELTITDLDIAQVMISKSKSIGSYHMMMGQNPVYVISFQGV